MEHRCNPGKNGIGIVAILPVQVLSESLQASLIASFVKDVRKLSIGLVVALYVTFGQLNFVHSDTSGPQAGRAPHFYHDDLWLIG